jgi:hypothetical protein
MANYEFVTVWRVSAPIEAVWNEIYHAERWPTWWKGIERVVELQKGDEHGVGSLYRYTCKSRLPYRLTFEARAVCIEPPCLLEGLVAGELEGYGRWQLWSEKGGTIARYDWKVRTTKQWMRLMAPVACPLFAWNHHVLMGWGAEGLATRLGVNVDTEKV